MSNPSERLLIAAANGNLENVVQELKNNANINSTDLNGYAPIHCAVYNNKVEVVKYLVKMGANLLLKDSHAYVGFTPLHYASAFGSIEMVKALLLTTEQNIHCKNSTGQTPADVSSNSEVKAILLQDELSRRKVEKPVLENVEIKTENVQNEQPKESNCCDTSKCCKGGKIGKFILGGIVAMIFFGAPALQFFLNVEGFPLYIFPCSIIIWALGLVKIHRKSKKNEKFREKKGLAIHAWTVLVFNIVCLVINLIATPAPWWILVALITGVPVAIHKILKKGCCGGKKEFNGIAIHGVIFGSFLIASFVLYCLCFPYDKSFFGMLFWSVPSVIWAVCFVGHLYTVKKRLRAAQNNVDVENPNVVSQQSESSSLRQNDTVEQVKTEQSTIYPQVL